MKLENIRGFSNIDEYVKDKLARYTKEEKSFETLFGYMFDEENNVMVETSDGYRIKKTTYGKFKEQILKSAPTLAKGLHDVPMGSMVGLYCSNCPEWIAVFWMILMCGYRPLLMNTRLPDAVLEEILSQYSVPAVISDEKAFSVRTLYKEDVVAVSEEPMTARPWGDEVIFMSSGTTDNVKLCAYTGENFYYQICDSVRIVEQCPAIREHYEGELKQLTLLPFYHVFGFIAVYLWFGFFSRTFVFPKDLNPATVQNTVKKHKVTHIFAVPMVWEAVHKAALSKIRSRGDRTYRKFERAVGLVHRIDGRLGDTLARKLLGEVRQGLFGDSIRFLITGGSHIAPETLRFFNGIGYHLANGYGMTEIGITSVEKSVKKSILNSTSIGAPFGQTEYALGEENVLMVRGRTMASRILQNGQEQITDFDAWFTTNDLARCENGRYYIEGRADDLIVCESGENLNPVIAEEQIKVSGVDRLCVFASKEGAPILLASVPGCFSDEQIRRIHTEIRQALQTAKLESVITHIYFTHGTLISGNDFKVSRRKIATAFASGKISYFDPVYAKEHVQEWISELESEIRECFATALGRDAETIGVDDHFFQDLGGTSIDYFTLLGLLKNKFGLEWTDREGERLATVKDFWNDIKER